MSESLTPPTTDPGLIVGNTRLLDPLETMHAAMEVIVPMLEGGEEAYQEWVPEYVSERASELSAQSNLKEVSLVSGETIDFIAPDVSLLASVMMTRPYHLDDPKAYEKAFGALKSYYEFLKPKLPSDRAYLNASINAVNLGQALYFETIHGDPRARFEVAGDFITDDDTPETNSIADFKGVAVCLERAAVAHNTLKILGITSKLETGHLEVHAKDGTASREAHAFLIVTSATGDRYIFDPTNPKVMKDQEGRMETIKPSLYKLEDFDIAQKPATLEEFTKQEDGTQKVSDSWKLTYIFEDLRPSEMAIS